MSGISKGGADRNQRVLLDLAGRPGNDVCADCKARGPRWASHNLGIFLCVNCASIHRKIGTHITKVKSMTMDSWTKEQLEVMKSTGNVISNAKYNPNESRHPPPVNREDSERDSEMEKYIRSKYEFKRFMTKSRGQLSAEKANSIPRKLSPVPPASTKEPAPSQAQIELAPPPSQPLAPSPSINPQPATVPQSSVPTAPANSVWNDMMSLSGTSSQLSTSPMPVSYTHPTMASPAAGAVVSPGVLSTPLSNSNRSIVGDTTYAGASGVSANATPLQPTQSFAQGLNFSSVSGQSGSFLQQNAFVGSHPFTQHAPVFNTSITTPPISHFTSYSPQMLPQNQVHSSPMGSVQTSASGFPQSFIQQQGQTPILSQGYGYPQSGFAPPVGPQQTFQPYYNQAGNNHPQWQQTQSSFSPTPQYNQWTS